MAKGKNKQPKKSGGKDKKVMIVAELSKKAGESKGIVFSDYQGLTNKQI